MRAFDYVNQPFDRVCEAVRRDAGLTIFHRATKTAADRGEQLTAALRVEVGGVELHKDVTIEVGTPREEQPGGPSSRVLILDVGWSASDRPGLFPVMKAELRIYPLSATETQLELAGVYHPPLGRLGEAIDLAVGHRIAEATVHRLVTDVASRLRTELEG